jgi:hypothetical protein
MNMNSLPAKLIITTATLAALAVTPLARAAAPERHEQKNLTASRGGTLTFEAMVGAIDLKAHDKDELTYDGVLKPGDARSRQSSEDQSGKTQIANLKSQIHD